MSIMYSQGVKVLHGAKHHILDWEKLRSKNQKHSSWIVCKKFVPEGRIINVQFYFEVTEWLLQKIRQVRQSVLKKGMMFNINCSKISLTKWSCRNKLPFPVFHQIWLWLTSFTSQLLKMKLREKWFILSTTVWLTTSVR